MTTCAVHNKPNHLFWVFSAFYYGFVSVLLAIALLSVYWQVEPDETQINMTKKSVVAVDEHRDFYVDLDFCTSSDSPITIERYYKNIQTGIYYTTPTGVFPMDDKNCLKARIHAYAGRFEPGMYEYHVSVKYQINPLREET